MSFGQDVFKYVVKPSLNTLLDTLFPAARDVYLNLMNERNLKGLEKFYENKKNPGYRLLMEYGRIGKIINVIHKWEEFYKEHKNWPHASIRLLDELKLEKDESGIELLIKGKKNLDLIGKNQSVVYALPHDYGELEGIFAWAVIGSYICKKLGKELKEVVNDLFGAINNFDKAAFFVMNVVHLPGYNEKVRINLKELKKSIKFLKEEKGHLGTFLSVHNRYIKPFGPPGIFDGEVEEGFAKFAKYADLVVPLYIEGPKQPFFNYLKGIRNVARIRYLFSFGGKQFILYIGKPIRTKDLVGKNPIEIAEKMRGICRSLPYKSSDSIINVKELLPK